MKYPRLLRSAFRYDETQQKNIFDISHNGIGILTDCISCTVKETLNKQFSLELVYPQSGRFCRDFKAGRVIVAKPNYRTSDQAFVISEVKYTLNKNISVVAEHISNNAKGIMVTGFNAGNSIVFASNLNSTWTAIANYFHFDYDFTGDAKYFGAYKPPRSLWSMLLKGNESFLGLYGGEFEFDNLSIFAHKERGKNNGVTFRVGHDVLGLNATESLLDVATGYYPYWYMEGEGYVELDERVIYTGYEEIAPISKVEPLDLSYYFDAKPTTTALREAAQSWMNRNVKLNPNLSLKVSIVGTRDVLLGDTVTIVPNESMPIQTTVAKITEMEYDVLKEQTTSINVGDVLPDLYDSIAKLTGGTR